MIFMTKPKSRRDYIARRIGSSVSDDADHRFDTGAMDGPGTGAPLRSRLLYQLPSWAMLGAFLAIPVAILVVLLTR